MTYRIAIDTGGTFTDVVVADDKHNLIVNKALTDHSRVFNGIKEALGVTAKTLGVTVDHLLANTTIFIYATTRATNAILENKCARTAFLTTAGFKDTLLLREGGRPNAYDFSQAYPDPYVPRRLSFEIEERINAEGEVVKAMDEQAARTVLRQIKAAGVEAIGVSLLWSIANEAHELRLGELITEELPGVPYTLSHQINPVIREYRRASAAVIDASLKPLMQEHLRNLEIDLKNADFVGELFTATSFGGVMSVEQLIQRPIYSTRSGPSMAPISGKVYGAAELGAKDVIICDTGGTSFDVSMVRDGNVVFTGETWLGGRYIGHLTGLSSVDARSIGAGGGSIAWVDEGGLLRVGPQSAGSEPGPAAYGRGGQQPTVTDAATVLGYLNPDNFLGGRLTLDVQASRAVIAKVADPLGISVEEAAVGIMRIASEHMVQAVQEITVNEGVDPRDCLMVAGGGAAGLNIAMVVKETGAKQVLIPRTAGGLSACGAQFSDIISEFNGTSLFSTRAPDFEQVNALLASFDAQIDELAKDLAKRDITQIERSYFAEVRYEGQAWELEVPLRVSRFTTEQELTEFVEDFHAVHHRVFAVIDRGSNVEAVAWKARMTAIVTKPQLVPITTGDRAEPHAERYAHFHGVGTVMTPCYDGPGLPAGTKIQGPAVIEEPTTTVVVYPGMTATVTSFKNYLIDLGGLIMTTAIEKPVEIDPATLAVISNRINAILREMTNTLLRSGRSAILTTARDFSCSIVTADNRLLATAEGLPVHIFGSHLQTATMSELHDDIQQGDAYLHNDPYSGNTHAADHTILVPVFIKGRHMFTAVAKAHQADIGNSFPTTYMPMANDLYEEGALFFPATRIQRNNEDVKDIIRMCRLRIRVPDQWYGDYLACLGSARIGERRLTELAEKYGAEVIEAFVDEWFAYSERRIEHAIKKLKSGVYTALTHHDPLPGIIEQSIPVKVTATVDAEAGRITIDLRDNMDCLPAGINMSRATSTNSAVTGLFNVLDADMPHNHGTLQRVDVLIRENCIVGFPRHPTSCSMATSNLADRVINATQTALSAAGDFGLAEGGASLGAGTSVIAGKDERRGDTPYVNQLVVTAMGGAASAVCDGWLTMGVPVTGGLLLRDSVEIDEQKYPVHFDRLQLVVDSGGEGKHRGGAATLIEYGPRFSAMTVAVFADSGVNPAKGTQGGLPGRPHYMGLKDLDTGIEKVIPSFGQFEMSPNQRLVGIDAGGGGYGSPLLREVERVRLDVLEGYVSLARASDVYGVVFSGQIEDESLVVDAVRTQAQRASLQGQPVNR